MKPDPLIIPTTEPFFFPGMEGRPGCLLVHGFTGAPKEMRWLGEYLNQEHGFTCLGIRLFAHATRPEDMVRARYTDWMASVEDGYNLLDSALGHRPGLVEGSSKRGGSKNIYLVGLSMGGMLSLLMSTRLDVAWVVAMSTPYRIPTDYPAWLIKLLSKFMRYQPKGKEEPGATWFDKEAFAKHVSYPQNPVRSGAELQYLAAEMRAAIPQIDVPVLLIHSKNDTYVLPENMDNIFTALQTSDRQKMWVTEAGHVVTRDAARSEVFRAAAEFIQRIESAA